MSVTLSEIFSTEELAELEAASSAQYQLSKTSFLKGKKCIKNLFLYYHKPEERDAIPPRRQQAFNAGHSFEAQYKATFSAGIDLKVEVGNRRRAYPIYTQALIEKQHPVIFEAAFIHDDVLVLADVLVRHPDGSYTIHEVKNSRAPRPTFIDDMAVQHFVISHHLPKIRAFNLVIRASNPREKFQLLDQLDALKIRTDRVGKLVSDFKRVLAADEPQVPMGTHCRRPYECEFIGYCTRLRLFGH